MILTNWHKHWLFAVAIVLALVTGPCLGETGAPVRNLGSVTEKAHAALKLEKDLDALLSQKRFTEALKFIESQSDADNDDYLMMLMALPKVPQYATDGLCLSGKVKYTGNEFMTLFKAFLPRVDFNWQLVSKEGFYRSELRRNPATDSFLSGVCGRCPACFSKEDVSNVISMMLDDGLKTSFFGQEFGGSPCSRVSYVLTLDDERLSKRILDGVRIVPRDLFYLYSSINRLAHATLLEQYGYKLSRGQYKKLLTELQKLPRDKFAEIEPALIEHYRKLAQ